jgi:very-short-patch-repair endonuclease
MSASEPVQVDKSLEDSAICSEAQESERRGGKARSSAAICHFEQVRGRGDAEVMRLAELQHGHVHRLQLRDAGIGRGAISHRLGRGLLRETFPSVYRIAGAPADRLGHAMAAALFFRGYAVVCGADGATLWGLLDTTQQVADGDPIKLLLVGRSYKPRPGIHVRRTQNLPATDIRWRHGIPVTSPARTILDLAASTDELELEAVLSVALGKRIVRKQQLEDVIERNPRAKGIGMLRMLLEQTTPLHDTRSGYERKLLKLLKQAELPLPITNTWVAGEFVDGVWPDLKLVVEFDGWKYHRGRDKFETDRLRDQHVTAAGHHVIRVTAHQIDHRPHALIARIATMITTLRLSAG